MTQRVPDGEEILAALRSSLVAVLEDRGETLPDDFGPETRMFVLDDDNTSSSLDLDSLDALDLIAELEARFGFELPDDVDFEKILTIGDVVLFTQDMLASSPLSPE